jgi:hypothetical protein
VNSHSCALWAHLDAAWSCQDIVAVEYTQTYNLDGRQALGRPCPEAGDVVHCCARLPFLGDWIVLPNLAGFDTAIYHQQANTTMIQIYVSWVHSISTMQRITKRTKLVRTSNNFVIQKSNPTEDCKNICSCKQLKINLSIYQVQSYIRNIRSCNQVDLTLKHVLL